MFADRQDAGRQLADEVTALRERNVVVLGLPRGGVPVAFEVASALGAPLDVIVVRKLGVPGHAELGMGAVAEGGVRVLNRHVMDLAGVSPEALATVEQVEQETARRRASSLRQGRAPASLAGHTAVIVDDGIATGSTAQAACQAARARGAARVVMAAPVAAPDAVALLRRVADEVVCVDEPQWFAAISQWYDDFSQTSEEEVTDLLERAARAHAAEPRPIQTEVTVDVDAEAAIAGDLTAPTGALGIVIFAHGSGSSRHSPRNGFVARVLNEAGFATLLLDLLTPAEDLLRANVFDIGLLASRLTEATRWVRGQPWGTTLPVGWFGASTGGGAALWAAAEPGADVAAIVSRGGRPDLAAERLSEVRAPTLLVVGGEDDVVLDLNRSAQARMLCPNQLSIVPGATHLFEEPGALEEMADLACDWFRRHLHPMAISARAASG